MQNYKFSNCRGKEGENVDGMFMEKADSIVKKNFKDFKDFQATWLVKVTWENMTLYGHKDKVQSERFYNMMLI